MDPERPLIEQGAIVWNDDGILSAVGSVDEMEQDGVQWRSVGGRMVMPGMICAHGHLYGFLARGISLKDEPPENFTQILERLWWRLDKALDEESVEMSAMVGLLDCIRGGTTTFIDHHASPTFVEGSLDVIAKAARQVGMRVCACYEVSDRDGVAIRDAGIEENLRFARLHSPGSSAELSSAIGIHACFTVSDETLEHIAEQRPSNVGIHIHLCEDAADAQLSIEHHGARPLARLDKFGLLTPEALLAHGVYLTNDEIDLIADRGARLLHNPMSNMNNAVGVAPVLKFLERGIVTGLGSDGYSATMFDELAVASILHKLDAHDPRRAFVEPYEMLFVHNPAIASSLFSVPLGTLKKGSAADFLVMDYDPPTPMSSDNLIGHALFGFSRVRPDEVIIAGKKIYADGAFPGVDVAEIASKARRATKGLWERF